MESLSALLSGLLGTVRLFLVNVELEALLGGAQAILSGHSMVTFTTVSANMGIMTVLNFRACGVAVSSIWSDISAAPRALEGAQGKEN
jgi:hypothetical protein